MVEVICTLILLTHNGKMRTVVQTRGVVIQDDDDHWQIDFTDEIKKRKLDPQWNNYVQKLNSNSCSYINK